MSGCGRVHFLCVCVCVFMFSVLELVVCLGWASNILWSFLYLLSPRIGHWLSVKREQVWCLCTCAAVYTTYSSSFAVDLVSNGSNLKMLQEVIKVVPVHWHSASCSVLQGMSDVLGPVAGDALERFLDEKTFSCSTNRNQTLVHFQVVRQLAWLLLESFPSPEVTWERGDGGRMGFVLVSDTDDVWIS